MAEQQTFRPSDLGKQEASDAFYECDACRFEGTVSEGTSFCNICREFLCDECKRVHRKSSATRDHDLTEGASLHKVQSQRPTQAFEFCLKHPGKLVKFYCTRHDNVICDDCRVIAHGSCPEINTVTAASGGCQSSSKEVKKFIEQIQSTKEAIADIYDEKNRYLIHLDVHKQNLLKEITAVRAKVNTLLDRLEKETRQEVISTITQETNKVQNDLSTLTTLRSSLERDKKHLDAAKSTGCSEKIFLAMKRVSLQDLQVPLDTIDKEQYIIKIDFTANQLLDEILSSLHCFGSLETKFMIRPANTLPVSLKDRKLVKVAERDVQQHNDEKTCSITGSIFLPKGESLICDFANSKVKLLNTDMALRTGRKFTSGPWDVAMVTENEVVISLPDEKRLQYVTVPGLAIGRKIEIGRRCYALAVHNDQIFVTCHANPGNGEVLVVSKNGAIQRSIGRTGDGSYTFNRPDYVTLDALGGKIFVSDRYQHTVTCLTMEGGPVYHCVLEGAGYSRSLLVDSVGGVLVGSNDSRTASLQFLTPDGKHYRTLMTWPIERWQPHTFCFRSRDRSLLVGMRDNKILVYRFE